MNVPQLHIDASSDDVFGTTRRTLALVALCAAVFAFYWAATVKPITPDIKNSHLVNPDIAAHLSGTVKFNRNSGSSVPADVGYGIRIPLWEASGQQAMPLASALKVSTGANEGWLLFDDGLQLTDADVARMDFSRCPCRVFLDDGRIVGFKNSDDVSLIDVSKLDHSFEAGRSKRWLLGFLILAGAFAAFYWIPITSFFKNRRST